MNHNNYNILLCCIKCLFNIRKRRDRIQTGECHRRQGKELAGSPVIVRDICQAHSRPFQVPFPKFSRP